MADDPVETHYTRQDLGGIILAALKRAGKDIDHLTPDDLAPVDEFHGGQRQATIRLADLLGFRGGERVLDIGSGIGGPSRFLASRYGCQVAGIDLTAEFCRVAEMLTRLTGLTDKVGYRQGNALDLPFEDMSFDVVWSQNASMNIADRDRLYSEMHRVLKPGGRLALQEVVGRPRRRAALPGALGARGEHQLSADRGGDAREARSRRLSRRHLAGHHANILAILDPRGRGRAAATRDSFAGRTRLGGDRAQLGAELPGGQGPVVQRGARTTKLTCSYKSKTRTGLFAREQQIST